MQQQHQKAVQKWFLLFSITASLWQRLPVKGLRTQDSRTHSSFPADCLRPEGRPCRSLLSWCCSFRLVTGSRASDLCGWKTVRWKSKRENEISSGVTLHQREKMVTVLLVSVPPPSCNTCSLWEPCPVTRVYPAGRRCDGLLLCPPLLPSPYPSLPSTYFPVNRQNTLTKGCQVAPCSEEVFISCHSFCTERSKAGIFSRSKRTIEMKGLFSDPCSAAPLSGVKIVQLTSPLISGLLVRLPCSCAISQHPWKHIIWVHPLQLFTTAFCDQGSMTAGCQRAVGMSWSTLLSPLYTNDRDARCLWRAPYHSGRLTSDDISRCTARFLSWGIGVSWFVIADSLSDLCCNWNKTRMASKTALPGLKPFFGSHKHRLAATSV